MARYEMREMCDMSGEGKRRFYPRMKVERQMQTDELVQAVCEESTFNEGEVRGVLAQVAHHVARALRDGKSVKIEGVGVFTLSLGLKEEREPETEGAEVKRNARSVEVRNVLFRADKQLVEEAGRGIRLERASEVRVRRSTPEALERRLGLAKEFLTSNPYMRVSDYCRLTGLPVSTASLELRRLAADPASGIRALGRSSHRIYVLGR